jgi:hypothetical protein
VCEVIKLLARDLRHDTGRCSLLSTNG